MDGKKIYQIQINGINESINAVEALNQKLQVLDKRISELSSKTVNVTTRSSGGGGGSSTNASLTEEVALEKELNKLKKEGVTLDAKITATQDEVYKKVQATKDLYKEAVEDQKALSAQERLTANEYSTTMAGLKQHLADLKTVINTTDLGDSDSIKKMTEEANELTNKLKEMEEAYGQFGRNVGNYKSAFDDFGKVTVQVGSTAMEFSSVREASRQLEQGLKALVISGKEDTKEFKELSEAVHNFEMASKRATSAVEDLKASSTGMDNMLDMMESFGAMGQVTRGFSSLFGIDAGDVEKNIQKLVGLQNAMKGIEKIRQQMVTQEGIGGVITKGFDKIDELTHKTLVFNRALNGTGTSGKVAAIGIKALSTAIKGIATLGLAAVVDLLIEGATKLAEFVKNWVKGDAELVDSTSVLNSQIQKQNEVLDKNLKLIQKRTDAGELSAMDARIEKEKAYAQALLDSAKALKNRQETYEEDGLSRKGDNSVGLTNVIGDKGVTTIGGFSTGIKDLKDFSDRFDYLLDRVSNGKDIFGGFTDTVDDAKDELVHITKLVGGDFVNAMKLYADGTKEGTTQLVNYIRQMDVLTSGRYSQSIKLGIDKGYFDAQIKQAWDLYQNFKQDVESDPVAIRLNFESLANQFIEAGDKFKTAYYQRQREALISAYKALGNDATAEDKKLLDQALASIDKQEKETRKSVLDGIKRTSDQEKKKVEEAQRDLNALKIAQMKEGLNKQLKQLEEERKAKINKIRIDGILVRERELEVNNLYDKKIEKVKKEHSEKVKEAYRQMWEGIFQMNLENERRLTEITKRNGEKLVNEVENMKNALYNQNISSYGIQGKEQYTPETQKSLGILSNSTDKMVADYKKLIDVQRDYQTATNLFYAKQIENNDKILDSKRKLVELEKEGAQEEIEIENQKLQALIRKRDEDNANLLANLNKAEELYNKQQNYIDEYYKTEEEKQRGALIKKALLEEAYSESLSKVFEQRISIVGTYWAGRINQEKKNAETLYNQNVALEKAEYEARRRNLKSQAEALQKQAEKSHEDGLLGDKEYSDAVDRIWKEHAEGEVLLEKQHSQNLLNIEKEKVDSIKTVNAEYYQESLQELRDFQTALSNLESKQPVYNALGIVNLKQTNKNNRELLASYESLARELKAKRESINYDYKNGFIDEDVYKSSLRELDSFAADLGDKMDKVKHELSFAGAWEQLSEGINQWVQMIGQAANQILSSLSEITQNQYQAQIDEQQKYIEKYEEMLDEQREITQKYADDVNNIEDELKTARGDRRQQLIDNLNAEMAAQRASLAQEKKIEKEKERAEERKKKLEHDQAVAKKKMDLAQAYINAAMAVSMAAVNKWPIPAIPMMALAAAAGAAQIAAVASQNIPSYGDGGVIQGKSHAQGGVKVLGGRAEVEGGEFITNKVTTSRNVELLEYVNSKKKRINLDDMIEFYGGNVRKSVSSASPKYKFAEGGVIPTLRTDIDINDRLVNVMEDYANRQVVVSVVDINDRQAAVREVEVLSGLNNE